MRTFRTRIATSMSWMAGLAAIASCTATDPALCGDDAYYPEGFELQLGGATDQDTYEIDVVADGTAFSLTQPPGGGDSITIPLGNGVQLRGSVGWTQLSSSGNLGSLLRLVVDRPPDESAWGPTTATVTVTMQGETVEETFTPAYSNTDRGWGESCRGTDHAFEIMGVPTP